MGTRCQTPYFLAVINLLFYFSFDQTLGILVQKWLLLQYNIATSLHPIDYAYDPHKGYADKVALYII